MLHQPKGFIIHSDFDDVITTNRGHSEDNIQNIHSTELDLKKRMAN